MKQPLRYGSVCSGIEAATVAWEPLGWEAVFYAEIDYRGKPAADGPKYEALGNSMAVPCMRWIGKRIMAAQAGGGRKE